jgi:hypothetical protein
MLEEVGELLSHGSQEQEWRHRIYGRYKHFDEKRAMRVVLACELTRILGIGASVLDRAAA